MALYKERQSEKFFKSSHPMHEDNFLTEWTYQISWRLNHTYELKTSDNKVGKDKLDRQIKEYLPKSQDVRKRLEEIRSIALPSVLECLQFGFATGEAKQLLPETTLTQGFPEKALFSAQQNKFSFFLDILILEKGILANEALIGRTH